MKEKEKKAAYTAKKAAEKAKIAKRARQATPEGPTAALERALDRAALDFIAAG